MSDVELTIKDKANILYRNGFLRYEDRTNTARIASRWRVYQTVPQSTARKTKLDKAAE